MENDLLLSLEDFFKEYDINVEEVELTDKEKLEMVKKIIFKLRTDRDWEDYIYSKKTQEEKNELIREEYVNKINNLDVKITNATGYRILLKTKIKKERQLKRKESFQKVLAIFKNNKTN